MLKERRIIDESERLVKDIRARIKQVKEDVGKVPMGDVLLRVFDQFADNSATSIVKGDPSDGILADIKHRKGMSLLLKGDSPRGAASLTILNATRETYLKYLEEEDHVWGLFRCAEFIAGEGTRGGTGITYKLKEQGSGSRTYGISLYFYLEWGDLVFPSREAGVLLETISKISKAVSSTSLKKYIEKQPFFTASVLNKPQPARR